MSWALWAPKCLVRSSQTICYTYTLIYINVPLKNNRASKSKEVRIVLFHSNTFYSSSGRCRTKHPVYIILKLISFTVFNTCFISQSILLGHINFTKNCVLSSNMLFSITLCSDRQHAIIFMVRPKFYFHGG